MEPPKPKEKLHWLWELDDLVGERMEYCKRHNYWYYPSKGCGMCQEEGLDPSPPEEARVPSSRGF